MTIEQNAMPKSLSIELKGIAILLMLWLHLFSSKDNIELYSPIVYFWNGDPLSYVLRKWGSMCVAMYLFLGGYGLGITNARISNEKPNASSTSFLLKANCQRVKKLYITFLCVFVLFFPIGCWYNPTLFLYSFSEVVLNITMLSYTFNGAWWFLLPYAILTLLSGWLWCKLQCISLKQVKVLISGSLFFFLMAYALDDVNMKEYRILELFWNILKSMANIQFPFLVGMLFARFDFFNKIYINVHTKKYGVFYIIMAGLALLVLKLCIGSTSIFNPFFVFLLVTIYAILRKGKQRSHILTYLGRHSTNIWLVHYFFAYYIFGNLIYSLHYPLFIFLALVVVSLLASYVVNFVKEQLSRLIY